MFRHKFIEYLLVFIVLNLIYYAVIFLGHDWVPFNKTTYSLGAHHYLSDSRVTNPQDFNLLRALGAWDGQWYLKIADHGYPVNPKITDLNNKGAMDGLSYGFFPLYPTLLHLLNIPVKNIELSAFIFMNILLLLNFSSLYFLIKQFFSENVAIKVNFLLWTFPAGVFFRSFYTEGLYLLLLIWFVFFLWKKRLLYAAILLGLMNVTKGNGFLLALIFIPLCFRVPKKLPILVAVCLIPLLFWSFFCYLHSGDFLYFLTVRKYWGMVGIPLATIWYSLNFSPIEVASVFFIGYLALNLRKLKEKPILQKVAALLLITPLFVFTMSFSRSQIISFPLFVYPAIKWSRGIYFIVLALQTILLFTVALYFVNWYWIG